MKMVKQLCTTGLAGLAAAVLTAGAMAGGGSNPNCPADLNDNGIVDGADLTILLGNWGTAGPGDLTGDGDVGAPDLSILLGAWGPCPIVSTCPASDHDCFTTGGPGCTDAECCDTVCAADPFCCETAWDGLCVSGAFALCGSPKCPFECTSGATPEGEPCGTDTNGGCNSAPPVFGSISCGETICGNAWASGGTRDTDWYVLTLESDAEITFSVNGTLPMVIGIVNTTDCATASALNPFAVSGFCGNASLTACLPAGTHWLFAGPDAFDGFPCDSGSNAYEISLSCSDVKDCPSVCEGGDHDCCSTGGPGCTDVECCESVCAADPFCCDTAWDALCVQGAIALCGCEFDCPESDHDCCTTGGPGCTDSECCASVCVADPFCCQTAWDDLCVNAAVQLCGCEFDCPESDHDCYSTGGPGCTDAECCSAVCAADPFCCQTAWDGLCVSGAFALCGSPKCPFECSPNATPEGEPCGTDTNGGCNSNPPVFGSIACGETICGNAWAAGGTRDTDWYVLNLASDAEVTFSVNASLPMVIGLVNSTDCGTASALDPFAVAGFCGTAAFTKCLPAGTYWLFAGPDGFDGFPCDSTNAYQISLSCSDVKDCPTACETADHDCCTQGTPGCNDQECCEFVCSADPFCCATAWDALCVQQASKLCLLDCPSVCENADHDCFTTGGPGCTDITCCELVCSLDPFCCDTSWDGLCVEGAIANCGGGGVTNDNCADAEPIFLGATAFSTIGATTDGPALPGSCEEGFGLALVNDIWYNFTATQTGVLTVSTCNAATYDTRLAAYAGTECFGALVGCNDDGANCAGFTSILTFSTTAGQSYKIRVGGFGGSGTGTLSLSY